jgi:PAS domain S-box-containing protein
VKDANPAFCQLFGLKHEKIANKHICVLVSALTPGQFHEAIAEDHPIEINGYHLGPTPSHQEGLYCDLIIWPVKSTESVVTGFVLIIKDVTDRLKVSQQRDEFITALAHDLKVPLAGAERFLESVLNGSLGEVSPQLSDALMTLRRSNKHMLWMVQNLLLTYQEQEGVQLFFMEAMNVKEVVEECLPELKPFALAANVDLSAMIDDDLPMILADRIGIRRVLINLTDNAIKASPAGSKISIIANRSGSGVCILVKDQGKGISPDVIPTLFKRFWKEPGESKSSSNTGLGLYVCKRIIEAHGGKIRCQSRLGEGASFIINLSATVDFGVDE